MFGQRLADFLLTQTTPGEMAALVDAAALLTYQTAWLREDGERVSLATSATQRQAVMVAAAMVKMTATGSTAPRFFLHRVCRHSHPNPLSAMTSSSCKLEVENLPTEAGGSPPRSGSWPVEISPVDS